MHKAPHGCCCCCCCWRQPAGQQGCLGKLCASARVLGLARPQQQSLLLFAGDWEQLDNHAEVVMHDFAACLLAELERWMLNASPAMVDLASLVGVARSRFGYQAQLALAV